MANDINSLNNTPLRPGKSPDKNLIDVVKSSDKNTSTQATTQDRLNVSSDASQLQRLQTELKDLPDVDLKRISELKHAIQGGTYKVNTDSIANKIIDLQMEDTNKE